MSARNFLVLGFSAVVLAAVAFGSPSPGAGRRDTSTRPGQFHPDHRSVELFAAMEAGELEVRFIARNSKQARVLIANKTDQPLNVRLPDVFAGVPVLTQFQPRPINNNQNNVPNNNQNNAANQAVGGGFNPFRGRGNGNGRGQNFFNVPAEQVRKLKVDCVCLEHGKPEPRAAIAYRLVPLETVTSDVSLAAMLSEFGGGRYDQRTAQAAAWYLMGDLDWEQLAGKTIKRANGARQPYFSQAELKHARAMVDRAENRKSPQTESTGRPRHGKSVSSREVRRN